MKVVSLLENTTSRNIDKQLNMISKHGLSLYIEVNNTKILFDVGPDDSFITNANALGVNLTEVDIVVISHGHSDHGGGLKAFLEINDTALIYLSGEAFDKHYYKLLSFIKTNISLKSKLLNNINLKDRFIFVEHGQQVADGIFIISKIHGKELIHTSNSRLLKRIGKKFVHDNFHHEVNLLVKKDHLCYLFTGCAHRGLLNIVRTTLAFIKKNFNENQLKTVYGGMHLMGIKMDHADDQVFLHYFSEELIKLPVGNFITCHCTGELSSRFLKSKLKDRFSEIHTGDCIIDL